MRFQNRYDAGHELADRLSPRDWSGFVVVAIPRGGVPVGYELARALHLPLELWVTRRLCPEGRPDEALGAVSEDATVSLDEGRAKALGISETDLMRAASARIEDAEWEGEVLRSGRARIDVGGRDVLLVDDGVTSGGTLQATVRALRKGRARRIVVAVPVAPRAVLDELQPLVDEVVSLEEPLRVETLADWYEDFRQPTDDEAIVLTWRVRAPRPHPPGPPIMAPAAWDVAPGTTPPRTSTPYEAQAHLPAAGAEAEAQAEAEAHAAGASLAEAPSTEARARAQAPSPPARRRTFRRRSKKILGWRRIATAVWRGPADPQIFGILEVDASAVLDAIARARAKGVHVTVTHVMGRAIAHALRKVPELNVRLSFGRHVPRPSVDLFFITAVSGGHDLTGVKVVAADTKSIEQIAREVASGAQTLRSGRDTAFTRTKRIFERLPIPVLRPVLRAVGWIVGGLGRDVRPLGLARSPFGSAMVTSVGMFGLQIGFSPLAWLYHVPLLVLVGEITSRPVALDGGVSVRPVLPITASIDHRFADGWQIAQLVRAFREYLEDPAQFEPAGAAPPSLPPPEPPPLSEDAAGVPSPS